MTGMDPLPPTPVEGAAPARARRDPLRGARAAGALGSLLRDAAVRRLGAVRTGIYANMESCFAVRAAAARRDPAAHHWEE
ncbi:MAG TPA: hypothetical protein VHF87_08795 [Methylomirabilota bacterium]|jgi:hypothetical protein|nr:hypothetical protein [Methylomirabilota bacterium]